MLYDGKFKYIINYRLNIVQVFDRVKVKRRTKTFTGLCIGA